MKLNKNIDTLMSNSSLGSKLLLSLLMVFFPLVVMSQSLVKGPRWYDEGKLSRRINISELTEGQEIPLFKQCLDGKFHVAIQLKYDIEGRQPNINWAYGLNVEFLRLQADDAGYLPHGGPRGETQLLQGVSGADNEGLVNLNVSNNETQTFVASALYGGNKAYIECNEDEAGLKNEYLVRVSGLPTALENIPTADIYLEFRLYEKPRYWQDYEGQADELVYLKNKEKDAEIGFMVSELVDDERILATWEYAEGAWGYELEWIFIGDDELTALGLAVGYTSQSIFEGNYKDPVRVETPLQHYEITSTYPAGSFYFRVRAVGRYAESNPNQVTHGNWVYDDYGASPFASRIVTDGFSRKVTRKTESGDVEEDIDITWQAVTTFAEEGKSKKVVTYYDASLRPRQVATDLNTDKHTLVAETYYDHEGRGTISVLPVPDPTNSLEFRPLVNRFQLDGDFTDLDPKEQFDNLAAGAISLATDAGAGKYYSHQNDVGGIHRDYIPDANGFAYTQVIYENDGMGRIKAQGGVGQQFALKTASGALNSTTTRYFYST
ncbi:MAG: DUF6443 domain-containing protein, partial [Flammeovirgaceae bacterium]